VFEKRVGSEENIWAEEKRVKKNELGGAWSRNMHIGLWWDIRRKETTRKTKSHAYGRWIL
jgi:hypothetical protein